MKLSEIIRQSAPLFVYGAVSQASIHEAEQELSLIFSNEYANYVAEFGAAIWDGHEFTGLCDGKRLDVITITKEQRKLNEFIPNDWYVIECLDIDGIVLWQETDGTVYATVPNSMPKKIANSIAEYIQNNS